MNGVAHGVPSRRLWPKWSVKSAATGRSSGGWVSRAQGCGDTAKPAVREGDLEALSTLRPCQLRRYQLFDRAAAPRSAAAVRAAPRVGPAATGRRGHAGGRGPARPRRPPSDGLHDRHPAVPAPVHDQVQGAPETVDRGRDHVAGVAETLLGEQGNELDIITGKLVAGVAIIAVPTAVTGAYGQDVPYPGFSQMAGLVTSAVLMWSGPADRTCCGAAAAGSDRSPWPRPGNPAPR